MTACKIFFIAEDVVMMFRNKHKKYLREMGFFFGGVWSVGKMARAR